MARRDELKPETVAWLEGKTLRAAAFLDGQDKLGKWWSQTRVCAQEPRLVQICTGGGRRDPTNEWFVDGDLVADLDEAVRLLTAPREIPATMPWRRR